ncbi:unnamed protein product [Albugo candida]|uniref:Uncharacterized protein n=1 Tax=Albugo candida TaxID=65357 RepID=A0A024FU41_9STRA|nr:unnamed protein product [Albugo candida]|eukprot:CCI10531.1 unnamed protein product [Albugo candida]
MLAKLYVLSQLFASSHSACLEQTLLEQLKSIYGHKPCIPLHKIPPTVGLNIARVELERTQILFWDLGGQERLRTIWSKYYGDSHGIIFVIDAVTEHRFDEAKRTLSNMLTNEELIRVPVIVLANKNDCKDAHPISAMEELFQIQKLTSAPAKLASVSAITKDGIQAAIQWILYHVRKTERFLTQ